MNGSVSFKKCRVSIKFGSKGCSPVNSCRKKFISADVSRMWSTPRIRQYQVAENAILKENFLCFNSLFYELDAQILYFNTFITFICMFRGILCSSSGGQIVLVEHLVSSLSLGDFSAQVKKGLLS